MNTATSNMTDTATKAIRPVKSEWRLNAVQNSGTAKANGVAKGVRSKY